MTPYEFDGTIPELSDLMTIAAEQALESQYASLPARVVSYDAATQCAELQPLVKVQDAEGAFKLLPVLPCCPVVFPAGGGFAITWKLDAGDTGHVLFSTLSMASWQATGNEDAEPDSQARGDLAQGYFVPGLRHQSNALGTAGTQGIFIGKADGSKGITVADSGSVQINGGAFSVAQAEALHAEFTKIALALALGGAGSLVYDFAGDVASLACADLTSD